MIVIRCIHGEYEFVSISCTRPDCRWCECWEWRQDWALTITMYSAGSHGRYTYNPTHNSLTQTLSLYHPSITGLPIYLKMKRHPLCTKDLAGKAVVLVPTELSKYVRIVLSFSGQAQNGRVIQDEVGVSKPRGLHLFIAF